MSEPREFLGGRVMLHAGDCRDVLRGMADNSIDSVVTDPPYALVSIGKRFGKDSAAPAKSNGATGIYARASKGFMGVGWDHGAVAFDPDLWAEVLRCMKPGAHGLAMGCTRTFHRLVCAIEDAGAEIRDMLIYAYGSGFPKSLDIAKSIDKQSGFWRGRAGSIIIAEQASKGVEYERSSKGNPITDAAREWDGWGTSLKPAVEMICIFRKPLSESNVALNVLKWGTGAINVGACRVPSDGDIKPRGSSKLDTDMHEGWARPWMEDREEVQRRHDDAIDRANSIGRWPANLLLSWPADEYELRADITSGQRQELFKWAYENGL